MWKPNPYTNKAGETTFHMRKLFKFRGWSIRLHKFTHADDPNCFHSHPAVAYRLILWGGYVEQTIDDQFITWKPFRFGKIEPDFAHRIHRLLKRESISLWIRGPITHKVNYGCVE
jgi:hypothetical protein